MRLTDLTFRPGQASNRQASREIRSPWDYASAWLDGGVDWCLNGHRPCNSRQPALEGVHSLRQVFLVYPFDLL